MKQDTLGFYFMKRLKQWEAITEEAKEFISQLAPLFMDGEISHVCSEFQEYFSA